jgi:hypothetical protein
VSGPAPGEARNVILAPLAAHNEIKQVTVVDADVDVHDQGEVEWAVATRFEELTVPRLRRLAVPARRRLPVPVRQRLAVPARRRVAVPTRHAPASAGSTANGGVSSTSERARAAPFPRVVTDRICSDGI